MVDQRGTVGFRFVLCHSGFIHSKIFNFLLHHIALSRGPFQNYRLKKCHCETFKFYDYFKNKNDYKMSVYSHVNWWNHILWFKTY